MQTDSGCTLSSGVSRFGTAQFVLKLQLSSAAGHRERKTAAALPWAIRTLWSTSQGSVVVLPSLHAEHRKGGILLRDVTVCFRLTNKTRFDS